MKRLWIIVAFLVLIVGVVSTVFCTLVLRDIWYDTHRKIDYTREGTIQMYLRDCPWLCRAASAFGEDPSSSLDSFIQTIPRIRTAAQMWRFISVVLCIGAVIVILRSIITNICNRARTIIAVAILVPLVGGLLLYRHLSSPKMERIIPPKNNGLQNWASLQDVAEEANVYEAVFRYMFGEQNENKAYYLTVKGEDPSEGFLARFKDHIRPVKKGSEFRQGQGTRLSLSKIRWIDHKTIEVGGEYHIGEEGAGGGSYRAIKKGVKWYVELALHEWEA